MEESLQHAFDHLTDLVGITALTVLALNGVVTNEIVAAIVTMAVGQRYAKAKWSNAYDK